MSVDTGQPSVAAGWDSAAVVEVPLATRSPDLLFDTIGPAATQRLRTAQDRARSLLAGRVVWNVNSTARGGGVAELLRTTLPYWRGDGIDARWLVMRGTRAYFRLTKRLHNLLHGEAVADIEPRDRALFERVANASAEALAARVRAGDIVTLQDPQTAGLVPILKRARAVVIWRCHVGTNVTSPPVEHAWSFLLPYIAEADAWIFTRKAYVPAGLDPGRVRVFPPAIDPCSPKNQNLPPGAAEAILARCGLAPDGMRGRAPSVALRWGGELAVRRRCRLLREPGPQPSRTVLALSRWDALKDPIGILHGFLEYVDDHDTRLLIAGPATTAVADDPGGLPYLRAVRAAWQELRPRERRRVNVAVLPMVDLDENALIVNALQRRADVIVKKSVEEGFGLGVTEALWKQQPVVATRVGGQQDQIQHRRSGLLVDDPADLRAFGAAVSELLLDSAEGAQFGAAGRETVRERYLPDTHYENWIDALELALSAS